MKKITLLFLFISTAISAQTVNVKFTVDASAPGLYPDASYDNLCVNGTFAPGEEWWGWGVPLVDDGTGDDAISGDGIWTGSRDIAENFSYEFVLAGTGPADGWGGWGVSTANDVANCGGAVNYTFDTLTSDMEISLSVLPVANGGGFWADCANVTTLSTDKFQLSKVNTFPNPTRDTWTVKTNNQDISSIQLFDILGKQVLSLSPNTSEAKIDGSALTRGLYFATITTDLGTSSKKLIKK